MPVDRDAALAALQRNLVCLNDIVAELVCGLAAGDTPTQGWAYTVVDVLGQRTRELGAVPNVTVDQVRHWEGVE